MGEYFSTSNFQKRRQRRRDVVSVEVVEEARRRFGLKKGEFASLMGISGTQYFNCERKGGFLSFRFNAALEAIELSAMKKAFNIAKELAEIKSGLKIEEIE